MYSLGRLLCRGFVGRLSVLGVLIALSFSCLDVDIIFSLAQYHTHGI